MDDDGWVITRLKRRWVPEWLWWWACNPLPFWNDTIASDLPFLRVYLRPLTWLLSEAVDG